jgi:uroporphyrinogen decarboxylase
MADTGAEIIEIDQKVDLKKAKELVGDRVTLLGNLDPTGVIFLGTPETIKETSKDCIMRAGKGGGFILSSGCDVPMRTRFRNIDAMVDAAEKYGKYPLSLN